MARVQSRGLQAARELGRTPRMAAVLKGYVRQVEAAAKEIAPRGRSAEGYADQIEGVVGLRSGRGKVLIGRVNAKKFTSNWIEFGTIKMRPFAPLRRALERVGFRVYERRRRKR